MVHLKRWTRFSKLFRLDRTDPLSFGPKFPEILVEWIAPHELLKTVRIFAYRKWSIKRRFSNKRRTFTEIKKICHVSRVCLGRGLKFIWNAFQFGFFTVKTLLFPEIYLWIYVTPNLSPTMNWRLPQWWIKYWFKLYPTLMGRWTPAIELNLHCNLPFFPPGSRNNAEYALQYPFTVKPGQALPSLPN